MRAGSTTVSVDLTAEELWLLFREADLAPPVWMGIAEPGPEVAEAAGRGLVARSVRGREGTMFPAVAEVLMLVARPRVFVATAREGQAGTEIVAWPGDPGVVVEVEQVVAGIWRFTPTEAAELDARLHTLVPAAAEPASPNLSFETRNEELERAIGIAPINEIVATTGLIATGVDPDAADAFVRSARTPIMRVSLSALAWAGGRAEGGTIGWLQGGDGALWLLPPSAQLPDPLRSAAPDLAGLEAGLAWRTTVRPAASSELSEAVRRLLDHEALRANNLR